MHWNHLGFLSTTCPDRVLSQTTHSWHWLAWSPVKASVESVNQRVLSNTFFQQTRVSNGFNMSDMAVSDMAVHGSHCKTDRCIAVSYLQTPRFALQAGVDQVQVQRCLGRSVFAASFIHLLPHRVCALWLLSCPSTFSSPFFYVSIAWEGIAMGANMHVLYHLSHVQGNTRSKNNRRFINQPPLWCKAIRLGGRHWGKAYQSTVHIGYNIHSRKLT